MVFVLHLITKTTIKGYKTLLLRIKQPKSNSYVYKQNQIKYKMIQNSALNNKIIKKVNLIHTNRINATIK